MTEQDSSAAFTNGAHNQDWDPATEGKAKRRNPEDLERNPNTAYVSQVPPAQHPSNIPFVSQVLHPEYEKLANPGPLGLIAFAITTFVVGLYECGAGLPGSNPDGKVGPNQASFGIVMFMGGTAQILAGLMQFRVGNTFGTTVHCAYGAFWLSYGTFLIPYLGIEAQYNGDMRAFSFALGIYLIAWCFLTLLFFIAALKTNIAILLVFGFLVLAFFFLSLGEFLVTEHPTPSKHLTKTGGAFAVVCAMCAFYAGGAGLMLPETTWVRFPVGEIEELF
jgi:succinate-acetate transporter protein